MTQTTTKRSTIKIAAFLLLALVAGGISVRDADARKGANRYSVVKLVNHTKHRIYYDYVWGEDERKSRQNSIPPGESYIHWWKFSRPNENWAPFFHVREHSQSGWFKLRSFFSPNTNGSNGREYAFKATKDSRGIVTISLHPRLYDN